eukprot:876571-Rhodomonas_salina.2
MVTQGVTGWIWLPFTQLDMSSTRQHEGAGLGLSLVRAGLLSDLRPEKKRATETGRANAAELWWS